MVTSISWPIAETTGSREPTIARATTSSLNVQRSSRLPPPRATMIRSAPATRLASAIAATTSAAAPAPWTRLGAIRISLARQRRPMTWSRSRTAAPVGLVTTTIRRGKRGRGRFRAGSNSPSAASRATVWRNASSSAPIPSGSIRRITTWYSPRGA